MADPAPSSPVPSLDEESVEAGPEATTVAPKVDATTFANTRQHVADRQAADGAPERFVNTKLNIALINDPKNGPRFTLTKREAGLVEQDGARDLPSTTSEPSEPEATATPTTEAPPRIAEAPNHDTRPVSPPKNAEIWREPALQAGTTCGAEPAASPPTTPTPNPPAMSLAALPSGTTSSGLPPAAEPPHKVPVDSSKTFVGPNGTYYDESWRWMDWRGTRQSWNWPAALALGHWFAYRRLYLFAGIHLFWLTALAAATVNDVPILALSLVAVLVVVLAGIYGNTLYFLAFRRAVDHITKTGKGNYEELNGQLAAAGGTSLTASLVMGGLTIAGIALALGFTYQLRGGFLVNLWPF